MPGSCIGSMYEINVFHQRIYSLVCMQHLNVAFVLYALNYKKNNNRVKILRKYAIIGNHSVSNKGLQMSPSGLFSVWEGGEVNDAYFLPKT